MHAASQRGAWLEVAWPRGTCGTHAVSCLYQCQSIVNAVYKIRLHDLMDCRPTWRCQLGYIVDYWHDR